MEGPVRVETATAAIARAEHRVHSRLLQLAEEQRQSRRIVGAVAVHLADDRRPILQRPQKAGDVGPAGPSPHRAVQDANAIGMVTGQSLGDLAGPVGRAVVDHENRQAVGRRLQPEQVIDDTCQAGSLVVGGNDDIDRGHATSCSPARGRIES